MILSQDQQVEFLRNHLIGNYEVLSDYVVEINGYQYLGYCDKSPPKIYKMVFSDVGGVWESPKSLSLTQNWSKQLEKINPRIRNRPEEFRILLKAIEGEEDPGPPTIRLTQFLQDCYLTESQHILACDHAAYETQIVRNAGKYVDNLNRMNYSLFLITGAPRRAAQTFFEKANYIAPRKRVFGTELTFSNHRLKNIHTMVKGNKPKAINEIFINHLGNKNGAVITNDPAKDSYMKKAMIKSVLDPFIIVEKLKELPPGVSISCPEVRDNIDLLTQYHQKWELGYLKLLLRSNEVDHQIQEKKEELDTLYRKLISSDQSVFEDLKRTFISTVQQFVLLEDIFYPGELSGIRENISFFNSALYSEAKQEVGNITEKLRRFVPPSEFFN